MFISLALQVRGEVAEWMPGTTPGMGVEACSSFIFAMQTIVLCSAALLLYEGS